MSGGRRTPAPAAPPEVVYRGVRWRRSAAGRVSWFNEGLARWVVWAPGLDAPPLPPEYSSSVPDAAAGTAPAPGVARSTAAGAAMVGRARRASPADAMSRRKPMTSPYRLVPLLVAVLIVAFALWQATRPPAHATQADIAAAQALRGQCLQRHGGTKVAPAYSPTPVACSSRGASVKVVGVLVPGQAGSCPTGSAVIQVLLVGVTGEPTECVLPVKTR